MRQSRVRPPRRPGFAVGCSGCRLDQERPTARQSPGEPKRWRSTLSYACRFSDAVDAAAFLFGGSNRQPELLLQGARKDAAHGVALPSGGTRHLVDGCALGSPQHGNDLVLHRWALCVRWRFRVRQRLDCRPQLIDQRLPVADLPPFFDTGKSVPQCQQPLADEWGGVQFLVRRDGNLAVIDCGRRLAAQRDSIIANDVDAHGWVLLVDPAAVAAVTPLTLSSLSKATLFRIILWRCRAAPEHGIARTQNA